MLLVESKLYFL